MFHTLVRAPYHPTFSPKAHLSSTTNTIPRTTNPLYRRPPHRTFHTTPSRRRTHYDTLALPTDATGPTIKKSFYQLSKKHHPDLNRGAGREAAEQKFLAISEAYSILGDAKKREKYDRDVIGQSQTQGQGQRASGFGNREGGGPVGGRPASGLSKRRGAFTGPPPSFYRSGGWGGRGEKRREHQFREGSAGGGNGAGAGQQQAGQQTRGPEGEEAPFLDPNDVPHFDRARHYRTNMSVEEQLRQGRKRRVWARGGSGEGGKTGLESMFGQNGAAEGMKNFLGWGTLVGLTVAFPLMMFGGGKG